VPDPTEFSRAMRRLSRERGVAERGFLGDLRAQDAALDRDLLEEEEREGEKGARREGGVTSHSSSSLLTPFSLSRYSFLSC
jgi:hypothetical protein